MHWGSGQMVGEAGWEKEIYQRTSGVFSEDKDVDREPNKDTFLEKLVFLSVCAFPGIILVWYQPCQFPIKVSSSA